MREANEPVGTARRCPFKAMAGPALLGAAAVAISLPLLRLRPPTGDEGALLTGAAKLLRGGVFYRHVAAYPTPGAWYLLAAAMRLGGESVMTGRLLALIAFAASAVLFFLIGRRLLSPPYAVAYALTLLAVKFWAWPTWSCYLYADVAFAAAGGGALAFLVGWERRRAPWFFVAGVLFAASALCKQTVGALPAMLGLAALTGGWLARRHAQGREPTPSPASATRSPRWLLISAALMGAGALSVLATAAAYFAAHGLFKQMVAAALVHPVTGYLPSGGVSYLEMLNWGRFHDLTGRGLTPYIPPVLRFTLGGAEAPAGTSAQLGETISEVYARVTYLVIPVTFIAAGLVIVARQRRRATQGLPATSCAHAVAVALMLGLFGSAFPRADYYHVSDVAPAWLLVGFIAVDGAAEATRAAWLRRLITTSAMVAAGLWFAAGAAAMAAVWTRSDTILNLPRCGPVRTLRTQEEIASTVRFIRSHTTPRTPLFVLGSEAYCYFLCDRYSPWPYAQTYPGQTGADDGRELAAVIERARIPYVIRGLVRRGGLPPVAFYAPALVRYVERNYHEVQIPLGGKPRLFQVLRRNDLAGGQAAPEPLRATR